MFACFPLISNSHLTRCWLEHMSLNETTGLDPDGIKLRVDPSLHSADYVLGIYWVWAPVIEVRVLNTLYSFSRWGIYFTNRLLYYHSLWRG